MGDFENQIRSTLGAYSVRFALACYALDGSPLHLWTVWRVCRKAKMDVPAVVLSYLDGVADKLDPAAPGHKREGRIENWVREAVLGNNKAPAQTLDQAGMVQRAFELSASLDLDEQQRINLAVEFECDESTVRRWLKRVQEIMRD